MIKYIKKKWTANLYYNEQGSNKKKNIKKQLLWGDKVHIKNDTKEFWKVVARGTTGYINPDDLGPTSLLELYFIDVGQGDGVLIKTPDDKYILIDGGWPRKSQPLGKNAADFVDWKFKEDNQSENIYLDEMICSHNDQDHYGGLWDLLDEKQVEELNTKKVFIEKFYHAGLSWWAGSNGKTLGPSSTIGSQKVWTRLLEDRESLLSGLKRSGSKPKFGGEWGKFLGKVKKAKSKNGNPTPVERLSDKTQYISGYEKNKPVSIKVLAPVELELNGKPTIPKFIPSKKAYINSKNTNGNSVLLRLDYKKARFLITGDLNTLSQQFLLKHYKNNLDEFECDVAKACHHGSGDVSIKFLEAMKPGCTIISSGDSEGHDHPKPSIIGASGLTGHKQVKKDKLITPLVYSTELARSIPVGKIFEMNHLDNNGDIKETFMEEDLNSFGIKFKVVYAGDRYPKTKNGRLDWSRVIAKPTYGLINVRTDGNTIMCAALNEKKFVWNISTFKARF